MDYQRELEVLHPICDPDLQLELETGWIVHFEAHMARMALNEQNDDILYPIPWYAIPELFLEENWAVFETMLKAAFLENNLEEFVHEIGFSFQPASAYFIPSNVGLQLSHAFRKPWDIGIMSKIEPIPGQPISIFGPTLISSDHRLHSYMKKENQILSEWEEMVRLHLQILGEKSNFAISMPARASDSRTKKILEEEIGATAIPFMVKDAPFTLYMFLKDDHAKNLLSSDIRYQNLFIVMYQSWSQYFMNFCDSLTDQDAEFLDKKMDRWYKALKNPVKNKPSFRYPQPLFGHVPHYSGFR